MQVGSLSPEQPLTVSKRADDCLLSKKDSPEGSLEAKIKELDQREAAAGFKRRELGVTWSDLTVRVPGAEALIHDNVLSQFNLVSRIQRLRHRSPLRTILDHSHGCVKPGEMLLVLGRPGSGCSTLLKMLSNMRQGYAQVEGNVWFGSMNHREAESFRGQIVMNTEEEIFFPSLTVGQTMDFATRSKVPRHQDFASHREVSTNAKEFLLDALGIAHTKGTRIGNEYIRGVSGGERKRVSVLECLASQASVYCWDNSTRGLDASNALEWARTMRTMTDVKGLTTIATLYQVSNDIYNLFDQVLVLDQGAQIYYGPRENARGFMESMGFICQDGASVADFLTGVTVSTERKIQPGLEATFPRTAREVLEQYQKSSVNWQITQQGHYPDTQLAKSRTKDFAASVRHGKASDKSQYTVRSMTQIRINIIRQYQIVIGDLATLFMQQGATLLQALVAGSLYYNAPADSTGLFLKGGALFWSLLYHSLCAMSEVVNSFTGRPVILKHRRFAMSNPAAVCISQIVADVPIVLLQITVWSLIVYFLVNLITSPAAFFTYFIILCMNNMCSIAMFRAIGAAFGSFDGASKISGYVIMAMAMYTGYQITKVQMHPWLGWLYWLNPLAYGFEALMGNELHQQVIQCAGRYLIPNGPEYASADLQHRACAGVGGAMPGATSVPGDDYLASLSYSHSHVWRSFGILCAWWIFYVIMTIVFTVRWTDASSSGASLLIPQERAAHHYRYHRGRTTIDAESAQLSEATEKFTNSDSSSSRPDTIQVNDVEKPEVSEVQRHMTRTKALFTWKNLHYTVQTSDGPKCLLDGVQGWVEPGTMTALMGSSGAGKTTLLDVLAQRKTEGKIAGSILVDGRPLPISFQRSIGYCEQLDVHEPYATVREALEFSALLRQSRDVPREERLRYVDVIIDLLELQDLSNTMIGRPGDGHALSIEQRKRVTIAVELVAKPQLLIFLDEPTSGLDGQSAYRIVRFLRKLADAGQGILVTVHQPSAQLFSLFDRLLLLARGGKTVYFGDIGENGRTVSQYFDRHGVPRPPEANPAEHMIDVVSGRFSSTDWNQVWLQSPEYEQTTKVLNSLLQEAALKEEDFNGRYEYAMPMREQIIVVLWRMNLALYRNVSYVNNKILLHIGLGLFNGFTYWMIGQAVADLQQRLFTVFLWLFVASGVVNQLQPLFIERRDLYDAREKKARIYSWQALVTGLIVSELPYLIVCGVLYFVCWYFTVGFSAEPKTACAVLFVVLIYEFLYTGMGQFIAAYAPNAVFAALVNPLLVGVIVSFCGILVPYDQIITFWKYWMYYLSPSTYVVSSVLTFVTFDARVKCTEQELAVFDPPTEHTCGEYLAAFVNRTGANLLNPDAMSGCMICPFTHGSDYLRTMSLNDYYYGWASAGIVVIFVISSYGLVYLLMKMRTKKSKKAE